MIVFGLLLYSLPCIANSPDPFIVSYRPMKPEIFFLSDVPGKLRNALLPLELVGPPFTCFRPSDEAVRSAMDAAEEAVRRSEPVPCVVPVALPPGKVAAGSAGQAGPPGDNAALATALLRRGALRMEVEELRCDAEYDRYELDLTRYEEGQIEQLPPMPACPDGNAAIADWRRAAEVSLDFPGRDQALYLAATELERTYEFEKAAELADRLRAEHPDSPLLFDSLLLAGVAWFEADLLEPARERLVSAADADPARSIEPRYRVAWIDLLRWDYAKSVQEFTELLDLLRQADEQTTGRARDIAEEARESIAWMLASDDWDGDGIRDSDRIAERTLRLVGPQHPEGGMLLAAVLEQMVDSRGREMEDVVALSDVYLERYPLAPDAPNRHDALVYMLDRMASDASGTDEARCTAGRRALTERGRMALRFGRGSEWCVANASNPAAVEKAYELVLHALLERAELLHVRAQEARLQELDGMASGGGSRSWYCRAQRAYIELLERFPDAPEQCELRRCIGDTAFYGQWNEAAAFEWLTPVLTDGSCAKAIREHAADVARRLAERIEATPAEAAVPPPPCASPEDESGADGLCTAGVVRAGDDYWDSGTEQWEFRRVGRLLRARAHELSRCGQRVASGPGTWQNRLVTVTVSVQADGRAVVHADGGDSQALERCIERTVSSWRFPRPEAAPANLEFKLAVEPQ